MTSRPRWPIHRARFDADGMVADFAPRLGDELDLATLTADLATTTAPAVQPTSLRGGRS